MTMTRILSALCSLFLALPAMAQDSAGSIEERLQRVDVRVPNWSAKEEKASRRSTKGSDNSGMLPESAGADDGEAAQSNLL